MFDLATQELLIEFPLAPLYAHANCNDVVLDESGLAYVNDSENPAIYRLNRETGLGELYVVDPLLGDSTGNGLGANGIEIMNEGNTLIITRMLPPAVVTVSLPEPDLVKEVELQGEAIPLPNFGIRAFENDLYWAVLGATARLRFSDDYETASAVLVSLEDAVQTTSLEVAESALYAVNSDVLTFLSTGQTRPPLFIYKIATAEFE